MIKFNYCYNLLKKYTIRLDQKKKKKNNNLIE